MQTQPAMLGQSRASPSVFRTGVSFNLYGGLSLKSNKQYLRKLEKLVSMSYELGSIVRKV